jgi:hypothetical protein
MKDVISPGDRVSVEIKVKGYYQKRQAATVLHWTPTGRISVRLDRGGLVKNVSPDTVKKVADGVR